MTPTACPEIGKVLLPGQIGSSVFGTCCAGNACWMGLTLMINSGIQRTGVWLSDIDCNTCPCCTVLFASLDAKQKFATLETEKGFVFSSGKKQISRLLHQFALPASCILVWNSGRLQQKLQPPPPTQMPCPGWVVIGFNLQMTTALTKASTWTTMAGSLWGGSSLQSFGRDTLRGFTHHLVLVTEKSSDDQHIFVDTYLDFIRFFESDASSNPACLFIYIYIHTCCICKCKRIYTYTNIYTLL